MTTEKQALEITARVDGASRGNPGPAAYAVLIESAEGALLDRLSEFIGRATNNVAEYKALLAALDYALRRGYARLRVLTDSELLARQVQGGYKVRHAALKPLHERAQRMISQLDSFSIHHVPREQNLEADRLVNQTLDETIQRPPRNLRSRFLRTTATYQAGVLTPHTALPLGEKEIVEVEIRRRP